MKKVKKRKTAQKFEPSPQGFEPWILKQNFPVQDLNFEGDLLDQFGFWLASMGHSNRAHGS